MINQTRVGEISCHCLALRKASRRISQLYDVALAPSGLKMTQRAILAQVERSGSTTIGMLAAEMVMDAGGLAHTLKPLIRDGYLTIEIDRQDRRSRLVRLTRLGKSKLRQSDLLWKKAHRSFEQGFGRTQSSVLRAAVEHLISDDFVQTFKAAVAKR
ncbi:MAG: MarR family winged helix-turn-helix transcriptional regulator [Pseudomonadota bacterium]